VSRLPPDRVGALAGHASSAGTALPIGRHLRPLPGAPARSSPEGASVRLQKICTLNGCIFCRPDALKAPARSSPEGASVRLQKICTLNGCIFCRPDAHGLGGAESRHGGDDGVAPCRGASRQRAGVSRLSPLREITHVGNCVPSGTSSPPKLRDSLEPLCKGWRTESDHHRPARRYRTLFRSCDRPR
jgi:hypothetical protein